MNALYFYRGFMLWFALLCVVILLIEGCWGPKSICRLNWSALIGLLVSGAFFLLTFYHEC